MEGEPSSTALATAVARGRHRLYDARPWILDDPFALPLVGPVWRVVERRTAATFPEPVARAYLGGIVARSRYSEDCLERGAFGQYVILGAGLDSFVWRRPDLARALTVYEVDHPASQAAKRRRADELGLPTAPGAVYVPVDLERDTLGERLSASGFDWSVPTFFSWLGVTMYLSLAAVEAALGLVTRCGRGSTIVFSYAPPADELDPIGRQFDELASLAVAASGEPLRTRLSREGAERLAHRARLEVVDHPDHVALVERYFAERSDDLRPSTAEGLLTAHART